MFVLIGIDEFNVYINVVVCLGIINGVFVKVKIVLGIIGDVVGVVGLVDV